MLVWSIVIYFCLFNVVRNEEHVKVIKPNEESNERLCDVKDLKCIRKEFLLRGWCLQSIGMKQPADRPLKIPELEVQLPFFKTTTVQKNVEIFGLHRGEISDFYINKVSDSAVLCIKFSDINVYSYTQLVLHRDCKQDILVHAPSTTENYTSITTTTQFKGLRLKSTQRTHAEVCKMPTYSFGNVDHVKDKEVLSLLEQIGLYKEIGIKELFVSRAQEFADFYIQNVICNVIRDKKRKEHGKKSSEEIDEGPHNKGDKEKVQLTHTIEKQ